jgi:deoxyribonuclease-4
MLYIGSHVGFKKDTQLLGSLKEALSYNANTFMFYTGAPQNTARSPIEDGLTLEALTLMKENNIDYSKVVVHAPYIINLCNEEKFAFSVNFLTEEINRCNQLGVKYMVLHPGSHVGLGIDKGIDNIIKGLNMVFQNVKDYNTTTILLETMAGKGTEVGSKLEEIKRIIEGVEDKDHIGVCLDTCHLSDAGYDIINFDNFLDNFDKLIGLSKIGCVHVNDSKNVNGSHKDRHENIGFGEIGYDTLINIIYNTRLENIPKILETPYVEKEYAPYKYEIEMIRNKKFDSNLLEKIVQGKD